MPFSAILIIYDLSPYSFLKYSLSFYLLFSFCLLVFLIFFLFLAVLFLKRYIVLFYLPNDSLAFTLFLFQVLSSFISSKCTQSYLFHFAIHFAFILISTTFWFPYLFFSFVISKKYTRALFYCHFVLCSKISCQQL